VLAAGAVVFDAQRRVLLVRRGRAPSAGEWTLPGGRVEPGETPEQAVVRELREETAIEGRIVAALGVMVIERQNGGVGAGVAVRYAIHEFAMEPVGDAAPRAGDDAADARWVARDELTRLGVRADAIAVVDLALARA
jgi:mutator protein MutT